MCYGGDPASLTVDDTGWSRSPDMSYHNGKTLREYIYLDVGVMDDYVFGVK